MPPSSSPTDKFSHSSIESMPSPTGLQSRTHQDDSDDKSESSQDEVHVVFPSKLTYAVEHLDEDLQSSVIDAMEDPPHVTIHDCVARDQCVIFQVSEPMKYTIRAGSRDSKWAIPSCSCEDDSPKRSPCRHILWLFDQITSEVFSKESEVLTLGQHGFCELLGNPYDTISKFRLENLAVALHSRVLSSADSREDPSFNDRRFQEAREIIASLSATDVEDYNPDSFRDAKATLIKRRDLEATILRMLSRNNEFFQYFLSATEGDEIITHKFRNLQQRADIALSGLDAYGQEIPQSTCGSYGDVEWCSQHLRLVIQKFHRTLFGSRRALDLSERHAAARTLLHILRGVADRSEDLGPTGLPKSRRNLYFNLIGDRDRNFMIPELSAVAPEGMQPFTGALGAIIVSMSHNGVPLTYVEKLRDIIKRARCARTGERM